MTFIPCRSELVVAIMMTVLLLFSGVTVGMADQAGEPADPKNEIRIGYLPVVPHLPVVMAYEADRHALQRSTVRLYKYNSSTGLEAAFRVGAIDLAILPLPEILAMAEDGVGIQAVASLCRGGSRLYLRKRYSGDSSFSDLTIGVPGLASVEHLELVRFLQQQGLQLGIDYTTFDVGIDTSTLEALRKGKIDAFFLPEPLPSRAIASLPGITGSLVAMPGQAEYLHSLLAVHEDLLSPERLPALLEWLAALKRATNRLTRELAAGYVAQPAISQAAYLAVPRQLMETLLTDAGSYLQCGFERVEPAAIHQVMDGMGTIGLQGAADQELQLIFTRSAAFTSLFSTREPPDED